MGLYRSKGITLGCVRGDGDGGEIEVTGGKTMSLLTHPLQRHFILYSSSWNKNMMDYIVHHDGLSRLNA